MIVGPSCLPSRSHFRDCNTAVLLIATLIRLAILPIWAVDIPIVNGGFEQVVLPAQEAFSQAAFQRA